MLILRAATLVKRRIHQISRATTREGGYQNLNLSSQTQSTPSYSYF
jgi:hypothetical protein